MEKLYLFECVHFLQISMCYQRGVPKLTYHGDPIYISYFYDQMWLIGISMIRLVTGIATKPWLSGNIFPNKKTRENGWSDFSENLRILLLKFHYIVNSIFITKSINFQLFTLILFGFGVSYNLMRFSVLSPCILSMYTGEVYACILYIVISIIVPGTKKLFAGWWWQ